MVILTEPEVTLLNPSLPQPLPMLFAPAAPNPASVPQVGILVFPAIVPLVVAAASVPTPSAVLTSFVATTAAAARVPIVGLLVFPLSVGSGAAAASTDAVLIIDNNILLSSITAAASAPQPATTKLLQPGTATANASTSASVNATLLSPLASAAVSSPSIVTTTTVLPGAASASAHGINPTTVGSITIAPGAASASASVPLVLTKITLLPPKGAATASAPTPVRQATILPGAASAAASVLAISITAKIAPTTASAAAHANAPTRPGGRTVTSPSANAAADTSAKAGQTSHYRGWAAQPVPAEATPLADAITAVSATFTITWESSPPVPGTYLSIDAIHRYNNQVYEFNNGWVPRTYQHTSARGGVQTLSYGSNDTVSLNVVGDAGQRFFAIALSEEAPVISSMPIILGTAYRVDLVADCSTSQWRIKWKINLIDQIELFSNRAQYYARAVSPSNWRQITLVPDATPELNEFDVLGYEYDLAGTYPIP